MLVFRTKLLKPGLKVVETRGLTEHRELLHRIAWHATI